MKPTGWQALAGALVCAFTLSMPAFALPSTVDFEDVNGGVGDIYESGQTFTSGAYKFEVTSLFLDPSPGSLVGQVADAGSTLVLSPPTNAASQFFSGYNDGGVTMTSTDPNRPFFSLQAFDFAFIPFAPDFWFEDEVPGALFVLFETAEGLVDIEFYLFGGADVNGEFAFDTTAADAGVFGALGGQALKSATFGACVFSFTSGFCENPSDFGDAWFALDNIRANGIPEPGMFALLALAAVGAGAARRRTAV